MSCVYGYYVCVFYMNLLMMYVLLYLLTNVYVHVMQEKHRALMSVVERNKFMRQLSLCRRFLCYCSGLGRIFL
jgi:hypothetical protein